MKSVVTLTAIVAMLAVTLGAAHVASQDSRVVCLPPAVVQALS
jgi:hypothetical protein